MSKRLDYIVYFRALAIILIVAGHVFEITVGDYKNLTDFVLGNLIQGSTPLFVFISGFMFDYVYLKNFQYKPFLVNKIERTLYPYLAMTLLAEVLFRLSSPYGITVKRFLKDLLLGNTFQAYWYVPFILTMFALSPLHKRFLAQKLLTQLLILFALVITAMLIQRATGNRNVFQSVIYFTPVYLIGMLTSRNRMRFIPYLQKHLVLLIAATLAILTLQVWCGQEGNMFKSIFSYKGFDLMVLLKIALSLTAVSAFSLVKSKPNHGVNLISETSFAIFFLHPFFIKTLRLSQSGSITLTGYPWIDLSLITTVIIALCVLVALIMRRTLKSYSKFMIGY